MPSTKFATIRYHALDRCFSNLGRKFYIEDLVEACNRAIYDATGSDEGVKRRQVYNDITFMESEDGWSIPLDRVAEGRRKHFRYSDPSFSIRGRGVNQGELEQIADTLAILGRFRGLPHFEWIDQIQYRLEETFGLKQKETPTVVSFEENPYLKGLNYFSDLLRAVTEGIALQICYRSFNQETDETFVFHPWLLKQYNSRWFVLGHNEQYGGLSTLALDRIHEIGSTGVQFIPNDNINFEEYFEDLIGVSRPEGGCVEQVILLIHSSLWPYIKSKPLHGSQRQIDHNDQGVTIELRVIINYELMSTLASHLDRIKVVAPTSLSEEMSSLFRNTLKRYS